MRFVFRVDASTEIGTGHVMRCLTLAEALRRRGGDVYFVCREHEDNLCDLIERRGFLVHRLQMGSPVDANANGKPVHAAWLGAHWQEDAEETLAAIKVSGSIPDWLVVDHYSIDARWESRVRTAVNRIMVIDDLADRDHDCDLLLDQNLIDKQSERYNGKVPDGCTLLLGPRYALLQPDYERMRRDVRPRAGLVQRIFVYFGGVDRDELTLKSVNAILALDQSQIEADIVLSPTSSQFRRVQERISVQHGLRLHEQLPSLAALMARADVAIGAGGATSWERLCLGLPAIVITIADNQHPIAAELSQRGLVRWLGPAETVEKEDINRALRTVVEEGLDISWSKNCLDITDGRGAERVCTAMARIESLPLTIRHAESEDEQLLLDWANDPDTRRNAFSSKQISSDEHHKWFQGRLGMREKYILYIGETNAGEPCGQVRFEQAEEKWEISYVVAPQYRGYGLGRVLLEAAIERLRAEIGECLLVAQVKTENVASRKNFDALGFLCISREPDRYIYVRSSQS